MRPNTMGIGEFDTHRILGAAQKIFTDVYKIHAYRSNGIPFGLELDEVAFIHNCIDGTLASYINENGYCTQCGKFLATHKKLEVMAGLKELND